MVNYIESPPLISSINENEAIMERLKNAQSWSILKDKRSDFIFVTKKRLIHWSSLSELTTVGQLTRHVFCTKVYLYLFIHIYCYSYILFIIFNYLGSYLY